MKTPVEAPLALTMGDPAGIGPDITLLAFAERERHRLPIFAALSDPFLYADRAKQLGLDLRVEPIVRMEDARSCFASALPVLAAPLDASVLPGSPDSATAPATIRSIERAVALVEAGEARAVVTNPISKAVLYGAGFRYPGHTEFLAALAARGGRPPVTPVMMLAAAQLKLALATIHLPLRSVPDALSIAGLEHTIAITAAALKRYFGLRNPRIAVAGLNPHAGEGGALGREEIDVISPAIASARAEGLHVTGPFPADAMFHAEARDGYDAAIAMYHDQGLAPFKAIAFDRGVNVTLGLPFVRTSPDHGTAFGLAGTGRASASSLVEALRLADRMARASVAVA